MQIEFLAKLAHFGAVEGPGSRLVFQDVTAWIGEDTQDAVFQITKLFLIRGALDDQRLLPFLQFRSLDGQKQTEQLVLQSRPRQREVHHSERSRNNKISI